MSNIISVISQSTVVSPDLLAAKAGKPRKARTPRCTPIVQLPSPNSWRAPVGWKSGRPGLPDFVDVLNRWKVFTGATIWYYHDHTITMIFLWYYYDRVHYVLLVLIYYDDIWYDRYSLVTSHNGAVCFSIAYWLTMVSGPGTQMLWETWMSAWNWTFWGTLHLQTRDVEFNGIWRSYHDQGISTCGHGHGGTPLLLDGLFPGKSSYKWMMTGGTQWGSHLREGLLSQGSGVTRCAFGGADGVTEYCVMFYVIWICKPFSHIIILYHISEIYDWK